MLQRPPHGVTPKRGLEREEPQEDPQRTFRWHSGMTLGRSHHGKQINQHSWPLVICGGGGRAGPSARSQCPAQGPTRVGDQEGRRHNWVRSLEQVLVGLGWGGEACDPQHYHLTQAVTHSPPSSTQEAAQVATFHSQHRPYFWVCESSVGLPLPNREIEVGLP